MITQSLNVEDRSKVVIPPPESYKLSPVKESKPVNTTKPKISYLVQQIGKNELKKNSDLKNYK